MGRADATSFRNRLGAGVGKEGACPCAGRRWLASSLSGRSPSGAPALHSGMRGRFGEARALQHPSNKRAAVVSRTLLNLYSVWSFQTSSASSVRTTHLAVHLFPSFRSELDSCEQAWIRIKESHKPHHRPHISGLSLCALLGRTIMSPGPTVLHTCYHGCGYMLLRWRELVSYLQQGALPVNWAPMPIAVVNRLARHVPARGVSSRVWRSIV